MPFTYEYARPAVAVDMAIFTLRDEDLAVLLIKRKNDPFRGMWALPGGFVEENEALEKAAARELEEETGLAHASFEQLGAWGDPGRDPRGHTVSIVYLTFVNADRAVLRAGDDASAAEWHPLAELALPKGGSVSSTTTTKQTRASKKEAAVSLSTPPPSIESGTRGKKLLRLAFDHAVIIDRARARLQERLLDPTRGPAYQLVPSRFTLSELQHVYQAVLGRPLDQRAFRKEVLSKGVVEPVALRSTSAKGKQLYRWAATKRR
jgi:8-oxo-dGTP diphosphatase